MKIVKGSDATITVKLLDRVTCDPYDLSGFTSATGFFAGADATVEVLATVEGDAHLGKLTMALSDTQTSALLAGDDQSFEVVVDQGATRRIVQFDEALSVAERLFDTP